MLEEAPVDRNADIDACHGASPDTKQKKTTNQ